MDDKEKEILKIMGFRDGFNWDTRFMLQEYVTYKGNSYFVSTVDLGLDHSFGSSEPLYYETMIFSKDSTEDLYCERYSTEEQAIKGHNEIIKAFKEGRAIFEEDVIKAMREFVEKTENAWGVDKL